MSEQSHATEEVTTDELGFWVVTCECGWRSIPCPARGDAIDDWGDHREYMARRALRLGTAAEGGERTP